MTHQQSHEWMRGKNGRLLVRESSGPQLDMTGPLQQRRAADRAVTQLGIRPIDHVYTLAHTGTDIFSNPVIHEVIRDARAGKMDFLIVAYGSRFARDLHDAMVFLDLLFSVGVPVYFCKEDVLAGYQVRWMREIGRELLEAHEFSDELSAQREETIRINWDQHGIRNGRAPFGYRWDDGRPSRMVRDERLMLDRPCYQWLVWIFERVAENRERLQKVCDVMNEQGLRTVNGGRWYKQALLTVLRNPVAIGVLRFHIGRPDEDRRYREDLRVIPDELFERVGELMTFRGKSHQAPERRKHISVLRNVARCEGCGDHYRAGALHNNGYAYLIHRDSFITPSQCPYLRLTVNQQKIEAQLQKWFDALALPPDAIARVERYLRERPEDRERELLRSRLVDKRVRARDAWVDGDLSREEWERVRELVDQQLRSLPPEPTPPAPRSVKAIAELGRVWREANPSERQALVEQLFERITLRPPKASFERMVRLKHRSLSTGLEIAEVRVRPHYVELVQLATVEGARREAAEEGLDMEQVQKRPCNWTWVMSSGERELWGRILQDQDSKAA